MNHYIDIQLLPDAEFKVTSLMNSLYSKLHKVLCDYKSTSIGVSFPEIDKTPGSKLRIHGSQSDLDNLMEVGWIGGMRGYCEVSQVMPVPDTVHHRTLSRHQPEKTMAKLRRLKNRGHSTEDKLDAYQENLQQHDAKMKGPYLELQSGSSGHRYRRYLVLGDVNNHSKEGKFDQFGLSKTATLPYF